MAKPKYKYYNYMHTVKNNQAMQCFVQFVNTPSTLLKITSKKHGVCYSGTVYTNYAEFSYSYWPANNSFNVSVMWYAQPIYLGMRKNHKQVLKQLVISAIAQGKYKVLK